MTTTVASRLDELDGTGLPSDRGDAGGEGSDRRDALDANSAVVTSVVRALTPAVASEGRRRRHPDRCGAAPGKLRRRPHRPVTRRWSGSTRPS